MAKKPLPTPGKIQYFSTAELYFDPENPRFYRLNDPTSVSAVIEEMLDDEGAQDLMLSIGQKGYFEGEPLLIAQDADGRRIVVEGNRRLAATKLLNRELEPPKRRSNSINNRWERGASSPQFEAVVRIAQVLQTSVDALVGLEDIKDSTLVHNPRLHKLYQQMDTLSDEDQQALYVLMDSLVKRSNMTRLLAATA